MRFIILFAFITAGCNISLPPQGFRPDMLVENYKTTNFKGNKVEWMLEAERASYYYDENRSIAENIILNYYKDDAATAVVKADRAIIYTDSRDIDLIGSVDMVSTTGNRLLTEKIRWNNKNSYLDTDEPVKILRKNGDTIEGVGLKADYNLETYEIKRNLKLVSSSIVDEFKGK